MENSLLHYLLFGLLFVHFQQQDVVFTPNITRWSDITLFHIHPVGFDTGLRKVSTDAEIPFSSLVL